MSNTFYNLFLKTGAFRIELYAESGLAANYSLAYPNTAPGNDTVAKWNTSKAAFEWVDVSSFGSGTVTSVGLAAPTNEFNISNSPVSTNGTLTLSWKNQNQNLVFASPNVANGSPGFRALVDGDLPSAISASKINGVLNKANIPNGTNATSFQLNGAMGAIFSHDTSSSVKLLDSTGGNFADFYCKKLFVSEGIDQTVTTTVNLGDAILKLLANTTGTPSENGGLTIERGTATDADFLWIESAGEWQCGLNTNMRSIARRFEVAITNTDLSAGIYTLTHNLGKRPIIQVVDNNGEIIGIKTSHSSVNAASLDFTRVGTLTGTWRIIAIG